MIPHELLTNNKNTGADDCRLMLSLGQRLLLLFCMILLCWIIGGFMNGIIISKFGQTTRVLRIASVFQSLIQIILPSIVTALMISRKPARFLEVDRKPAMSGIILGILTLFVSIPVLNCIIHWNNSLSLPDFMSGVESWMRRAEDSASTFITIMQGNGNVGDLVMNILIIGVMAGLGEELLFRGTIQRMLTTSGLNPHLAIWLVAALFSAIHMQFFGFVPRMLLGAFFGYMLLWSGSLWLPVIVHASNNILYVVAQWVAMRNNHGESAVDNIGTGNDEYLYLLFSIAFTVSVLWRLRMVCEKQKGNLL